MSVEDTVGNSQILLAQMTEEPEAMLAAMEPAGRTKVIEELRMLDDRAAKVRTDADLLDVAEAIHRLVEETPALARLLLPRKMDVEEAQSQRKITLAYHESTSSESQYTQKHAPQIRNSVIECRQALERALQAASQANSR